MLAELREARPGSYAAIDQFAFLIFVEVLREQSETGALTSGVMSALFDSRLGPGVL